MDPQNGEPLHAWLRAEQAGRLDEADRLFRGVMSGVPRLAPGSDFAQRVLVAVGLAAPARAPGLWVRWWMYALVGTALTLSAFAMASVSGPRMFGAGVGVIHTAAVSASRLWAWAGTGATAGWSIWQLLAQIGGALATILSVPAAGAFVAVNLLVAASALIALRRLLIPQEG
jgi:hypothetical protein